MLFVVLIIAAAVGIMLLPFTVAADLLYTYFLIQQAALCWLKLNVVELSYSGTMDMIDRPD